MNFFKISLVVLSLSLLPSMAFSSEANLSTEQKKEVENVVRELLLKKEPDLIIKAAQEMQRRAEKEDQAKGQEAIGKKTAELNNDPDSPVAGNPKGDITIVEFFDYQCGYCKVVQPAVKELIASDKKLRFVFKEYPILGPGSLFASQAALASGNQGKYLQFHEALMESKNRLSNDGILEVASKMGLNVEKLKTDMKSKKIADMLDKNKELAESLGARGTPTFIIGDKLYPGALPIEQIKELIKGLRKNSK